MQTAAPIDYRSLVDTRAGTVDRRIFSDAEIYRAEMERIFALVERLGPAGAADGAPPRRRRGGHRPIQTGGSRYSDN